MKKLLAALVAGAFAIASVGAFAAAHSAKDGKKDEMKKDGKAVADDMKKDGKAVSTDKKDDKAKK